jgi:hypothetical protein
VRERKEIQEMLPRVIEEDSAREHRIDMEVVVDAYNQDERAIGWFHYLEAHFRHFGFGNFHLRDFRIVTDAGN